MPSAFTYAPQPIMRVTPCTQAASPPPHQLQGLEERAVRQFNEGKGLLSRMVPPSPLTETPGRSALGGVR